MSGLIGFIGGSGIYEIEGIEDVKEVRVKTPFGDPSDAIVTGRIAGREVAFLPRHGRGHRFSPSEIPARANIYALKSLGCEALITFSACGSLKEEIPPRDFVIVDQIFDRTKGIRPSTFFEDGIVGHVQFGDPLDATLRRILVEACNELFIPVHDGGTYVCMEGPAFSTRAESLFYRSLGADVIGMTLLPEAKLAREAEIPMATVCLSTDYDCWHKEEVSLEMIIGNMKANVENVKRHIKQIIPRVPKAFPSPAREAAKFAVMTSKENISAEVRERLDLIIGKYL